MLLKSFLTVLGTVAIATSATVIDLSGTVTNSNGVPLPNAIISLYKNDLTTESSPSGTYSIKQTLKVLNISTKKGTDISLDKGILNIKCNHNEKVRIEQFSIDGRVEWQKDQFLHSGNNIINIHQNNTTAGIKFLSLTIDNQKYTLKNNGLNNSYSLLNVNSNISSRSSKNASYKSEVDTLFVSKAGYITKSIPIESLQDVIDITLDTLISDGTGNHYLEDGSYDRLTKYGEAQYFWGTLGNVDQPLVKITHAVSADAVDIEVIFSPYFVDNTYGVNSIGWSHNRGHTFKDLYSSDHVALSINNGAGDTVFAGKFDLISATAKSKSGYACLGPFGGDGTIVKGNASDVLSFGNSMDDNLNYYGYELFTDSPATDSTYTVNPQYPYWQYYVVYRLTLKLSAFGESGYGKVTMTSVHASPSKDEKSTITVTEKNAPTPDTELDVFRFILPPVNVPPVIDTIDVD